MVNRSVFTLYWFLFRRHVHVVSHHTIVFLYYVFPLLILHLYVLFFVPKYMNTIQLYAHIVRLKIGSAFISCFFKCQKLYKMLLSFVCWILLMRPWVIMVKLLIANNKLFSLLNSKISFFLITFWFKRTVINVMSCYYVTYI